MSKRFIRLVAVAALTTTFAAPASAQVITSRGDLNTLLGANQTLEDFERFSTTTQQYANQTLNSSSNWKNLGTGNVAAGVDYSGTYGLYLNANGYYGLRSHTLGDGDASGPVTLTYTAPITAFGLDLQGYSGYSSTGTISVFDRSGLLLDLANVSGGYNGASTFFGYQNAAGIGKVVFSAVPNAYLMIDNHGYGVAAVAAAVPEPATWAMMILGMGVVGFALRRRQKVAVSYAA